MSQGRRVREAAVAAVLAATAFHQAPGLTVSDTKMDLTQAPVAFLLRSLRLWEPTVGFGQLQNQAYGYLFPMGPFFAGLEQLGASAYVTGRAWWAVLLVVAFTGALRLTTAMGVGDHSGRLVAAVAYAVAPRVLTVIGPISSEVLPAALLPWAVLPLVLVARGRVTPRRGALLSALAVLGMGGVNASATLAVLPLPALVLLLGLRGRLRLVTLGWWVAGVGLATAWWVMPLLVMGRYSFPFLDYVESAAVTTLRTSAGEVLRGSTHWVSYVTVGGESWWRAGAQLAYEPGLVILTAAVAALGLAGLAARRTPWRGPLVASLLLGLAAMSAAWVGPLSGPLAPFLQDALDGVLVPFRNVHKFDPLVRLPLVVGLAHVLEVARRSWGAHRAPVGGSRSVPRAVPALAALLVVGAASPALGGLLAPSGSYAEIPGYWRDAARHVDGASAGTTTLLLPGEGFGRFVWGRTVDEPVQALMEGPWVTRQQAGPLPGTGTTRLLDAVEERVASGRPSPGLARALAGAGIGQVLVRHDLDWSRNRGPRPALVHASLSGSPGLELDAVFGPVGAGPRDGDLVVDDGLRRELPAIEVYRVTEPVQRVGAPLLGAATELTGDADAVLDLAEAGVPLTRPLVLTGEPSWPAPPAGRRVVTDSSRLQEVAFGAVRDNTSATLPGAGDPGAEPVTGLRSVDDDAAVTREALIGALSLTASSSASDAGAPIDRSSASLPYAAVDGDPATAWLSGTVAGAGAQWWQVDLERARSVAGLELTLAASRVSRVRLTQVTVTTDAGSVSTTVAPGVRTFTPLVPDGPTSTLRVSATAFAPDAVSRGSFGLAEVRLPGLSVERTLRVPTASGADVLLNASRGEGPRCVDLGPRVTCSPLLAGRSEEAGGFDRTVDLGDGRRDVGVRGSLTASALDGTLPPGVTATASSSVVDHPAASVHAALDGDPGTGWVAAADDDAPVVAVGWSEPRAVDEIRIVVDSGASASEPLRVRVRTDTADVVVRLQEVQRRAGVVTLSAPLDGSPTANVVVSFADVRTVASQRLPLDDVVRLPVGLAELVVPAAADLLAPLTGQTVVPLGCGAGPALEVDGQRLGLAGSSTRAALVRGSPLDLAPCDSPAGAALAAGGQHRLSSDGSLRVEQVRLARPSGLLSGPDGGDPGTREVSVSRWDPERRSVDVAAGGAALLVVAENANEGWRARTQDGTELARARAEGWKQAWVLPAGGDATVTLDFAPAIAYRVALGAGALAVLALVVLLVLPSRSRPERPVVVGGAPGTRRPAGTRRLVAAAVTGLLLAVGGPAGGVGLAAAWLVLRRHPGAAPLLAGAGVLSAGLVTALDRVQPLPWPALAAGAPHLLAMVSVGALSLVASGMLRRGGHRGDGATASPVARPSRASAVRSRA